MMEAEGTNCFSDIDKWPVSLDWRHVNLDGAKTINWNWNLRNHKSGEEKPRGQCCLSSFSNLATPTTLPEDASIKTGDYFFSISLWLSTRWWVRMDFRMWLSNTNNPLFQTEPHIEFTPNSYKDYSFLISLH